MDTSKIDEYYFQFTFKELRFHLIEIVKFKKISR